MSVIRTWLRTNERLRKEASTWQRVVGTRRLLVVPCVHMGPGWVKERLLWEARNTTKNVNYDYDLMSGEEEREIEFLWQWALTTFMKRGCRVGSWWWWLTRWRKSGLSYGVECWEELKKNSNNSQIKTFLWFPGARSSVRFMFELLGVNIGRRII